MAQFVIELKIARIDQMLNINPDWHFDSPGPIAGSVEHDFGNFITRMGAQGGQVVLECFKRHFASAANVQYYPSTNQSWAQTDLERVMTSAADNAPLFIVAFVSACEELIEKYTGLAIPDVTRINRTLSEGGAGYEIRGDDLVATSVPATISVPTSPPSLDHQAQAIIEKSLADADRALSEGNGRQAVQELLWLLETIATAFRDLPTADGTVQGKYFNKIVGKLRAGSRGMHQEQIIGWMLTLHGFLSAPSGGGVRHGLDLASGEPADIDEARLYCNLIRSYISYLITAHARLTK